MLPRVWRQRDVPSAARGREDLIMLDFLWSDPHEGRGLQPNARGGNTLMFGGDVTVDLLAREGLALLVRSHDWPRLANCVVICLFSLGRRATGSQPRFARRSAGEKRSAGNKRNTLESHHPRARAPR